MHLNTAVSSLMELVNELYAFSEIDRSMATPSRGELPVGAGRAASDACASSAKRIEALVVMISPFAPAHGRRAVADARPAGRPDHATPWPAFDPEVAKAEELVVPVQVNGKVRARLTVPAGLSDDELQARALADAAVRDHTDGKTVRKVVVGKGPLVSVVVQS